MLVLLLVGCPTPAPSPRPTEVPVRREVPPEPSPEGVVLSLPMGRLQVRPSPPSVGTELTLAWRTVGPNGCFRLGERGLTVDGATVRIAYRTFWAGDLCTEAEEPAGFELRYTPPEVGTLEVIVTENGVEVGRESIEVSG